MFGLVGVEDKTGTGTGTEAGIKVFIMKLLKKKKWIRKRSDKRNKRNKRSERSEIIKNINICIYI